MKTETGTAGVTWGVKENNNHFMKAMLLILLLNSFTGLAQSKSDNTIIVKGVDFNQVCNALLDVGYVIDKKDQELQTAKTEFRAGQGKNRYMMLSLNVRVKDSIATITGQWYNSLMIGHKIEQQEQVIENNLSRIANTHGNEKKCFAEMRSFAMYFKKEIEYSKQ